MPEHMRRGIFAKPRHVSGLGALLGARSVRYARYRRYRLHEHGDQGHGRAGRRSCSTTRNSPRTCSVRRRRRLSRRTRGPTPGCSTGAIRNAPVFYFFNPTETHLLDSLMQRCWTETQTSPLESRVLQHACRICWARARRCSTRSGRVSRRRRRYPACRCVRRTTTCGTRWSPRWPGRTWSSTSSSRSRPIPFLMPIENASVMWPPKAVAARAGGGAAHSAPDVRFGGADGVRSGADVQPVAHIAEHRPLGNVSRARNRMYWELAQLRLKMNNIQHYEPTGDETFPGSAP